MKDMLDVSIGGECNSAQGIPFNSEKIIWTEQEELKGQGRYLRQNLIASPKWNTHPTNQWNLVSQYKSMTHSFSGLTLNLS